MGLGNGIGIGWPMTSAYTKPPKRSGYFEILSTCGGKTYNNVYTIYVENVDWVTGQYVYSNQFGERLLLGLFLTEAFGEMVSVEGPAFSGCE
jgi:hypothetical protein